MSELEKIVKRHKPTCASFYDFFWKCDCGTNKAAKEYAALKARAENAEAERDALKEVIKRAVKELEPEYKIENNGKPVMAACNILLWDGNAALKAGAK